MNFRTLKNKLNNRFHLKNTWNAFYCCNDAVPWLNEANSRIIRCTVIFKNFQIHLYFVCHLPTCLPAVRPGSAMCMGPIFLTKNVIGVYNMNVLFRKRFIHCAMVIPFILHWPSLFFSKVSDLRKKVLITFLTIASRIYHVIFHVILKSVNT